MIYSQWNQKQGHQLKLKRGRNIGNLRLLQGKMETVRKKRSEEESSNAINKYIFINETTWLLKRNKAVFIYDYQRPIGGRGT